MSKRFKEKSLQRSMAALPESRIGLGKPFQITGVDLLGPLYLKDGRKLWVAAYTCAVYRAIHLELVENLEAGAFMMALYRFIYRRARPEKIYSDNGTNFSKLNRIFKNLNWSKLKRNLQIKESNGFLFLLLLLGWEGGRILGANEHLINNRPFAYVSEDDNDLKPLTPNEFLQNGPEPSFQELENLKPEMLYAKYRKLGQLKKELKQRFSKEYLGTLIQKSENFDSELLKIGDIVLIGLENMKRMFWRKGRIVKLISGKDGIARVAHVKTSTGTLVREIQRLYPLEISSNDV
ncbi:hypothetical protein LAZ67_20001169 [Cordylochernes scorpioides]|uniref:DUF5641 domain-containing protein n=1 Tax=Cordylochernes scorpioides TaxID=51811 RepID=A0ABY6LKP0_9ARAC|nr:hypothetical protein LAZ67_20001169 [Cordylochernes scorpioides]